MRFKWRRQTNCTRETKSETKDPVRRVPEAADMQPRILRTKLFLIFNLLCFFFNNPDEKLWVQGGLDPKIPKGCPPPSSPGLAVEGPRCRSLWDVLALASPQEPGQGQSTLRRHPVPTPRPHLPAPASPSSV